MRRMWVGVVMALVLGIAAHAHATPMCDGVGNCPGHPGDGDGVVDFFPGAPALPRIDDVIDESKFPWGGSAHAPPPRPHPGCGRGNDECADDDPPELTPTPEPATLMLVGAGLLGVRWLRAHR